MTADRRYYLTTFAGPPLEPGQYGPRLTAAMIVDALFEPGENIAVDGLSTLPGVARMLGGRWDGQRQAWFWPDGTGITLRGTPTIDIEGEK